MTIHTEVNGYNRVIYDDMNPRIYYEECRCAVCSEYFDSEEMVWLDSFGDLGTENGDPFCTSCAPDPEDDDYVFDMMFKEFNPI